MSKQVLDIEQMQHLKELGIDTSKASMVLIYTDCNCDVIEWDDVQYELSHPEPMEMFKELYDAETGNYDHSYRKYCGVFTLQDILDLLPKSIEYYGQLQMHFCEMPEGMYANQVVYSTIEGNQIVFFDKDVIGSAYEMLCWCIENGFMKTNKEN